MYTIQVSLCDIRYREVLYCTPWSLVSYTGMAQI